MGIRDLEVTPPLGAAGPKEPTMRLMTWNCLGMDDTNKQVQLRTYTTNKSIDYISLQEGDPKFDNSESESTSAGGCLLIIGGDAIEKMIVAAFKA
jgi:hypothetical protein